MPFASKYYLGALAVMLSLGSCSVEHKIAREYVGSDTTRSVLVMSPDIVYKKSLKEWQIDSAARLDERTLDSLLWVNSRYLQYIDDSAFINRYMGNYIAGLVELGFTVYTEDSLLSFLSGKPNAFIINVAQIELEEYVMPLREEAQFDEYIYSEVVDLNAVNLNSWFEISPLNAEEDETLFFASLYLTDDMEGYFRQYPFTGEVRFSYEVDTLQLDAVYSLGALAGYLYSGYTFDYLLNSYLDKKSEEEGFERSDTYYHFDRRRNYLGKAGEGARFIPME